MTRVAQMLTTRALAANGVEGVEAAYEEMAHRIVDELGKVPDAIVIVDRDGDDDRVRVLFEFDVAPGEHTPGWKEFRRWMRGVGRLVQLARRTS